MSNSTARKRQRRTRKLIDKSLQFHLVSAFVLVGCLATLFQVILLNNSMLDLSKELGENGDILLARIPSLIIRSMLTTMGLLIPALTLVGVLVTHRIAGPAYRMRCYFQEIVASGKVTYTCKIRRRDELQSMCDTLNLAVQRVQKDYPESEASESRAATDQVVGDSPSILPADPIQVTDPQEDRSV
ncbi:MAG: hypothetical protein GY930_05965 [bacterium]|nr:hypothetical protein [bacterium]